MNRHVDEIAARLSLRQPQRRSLEILAEITDRLPLDKGRDLTAALQAARDVFPDFSGFDSRAFPSFCFALATGVGKTRLMGAFVAYLHRAHDVRNFLILAPGLTVYEKLITDFTPGTAKYVLKGIHEFAVLPPMLVTGGNFEGLIEGGNSLFPVRINIFNIDKLAGARLQDFREELGESYFEVLSRQRDLVLFMDESHRYRAVVGTRTLNELGPVIGVELTATPFVETKRGSPLPFGNIIYHYSLAQAIEDSFVKTPAVVTRANFDPSGMSAPELEKLKLEDGIALHEEVRTELETYALQTGKPRVKPIMLVIARDTAHAAALKSFIESASYRDGAYAGKVIQVDSSVKEEETVKKLLNIQRTSEPTEIVVHVNMLKEGWDVSNLYTIVPLRPAQARILLEQSLGRGLRLPYGIRTGVAAIDRLSIVAHDRFQELLDEARSGTRLRLDRRILDDAGLQKPTVTIVSAPNFAHRLGLVDGNQTPSQTGLSEESAGFEISSMRPFVEEAMQALSRLENNTLAHSKIEQPEIRQHVVSEVRARFGNETSEGHIDRGVNRILDIVLEETIAIPRIAMRPSVYGKSGFHDFMLDLTEMRYDDPGDELWLADLATGNVGRRRALGDAISRPALEDHIIDGLVDYDDLSYDDHADLLRSISDQVVAYLSKDRDEHAVRRILRFHQRDIAACIHRQLDKHLWRGGENMPEAFVIGSRLLLKQSAFTVPADRQPLDFRQPVADKQDIASYIFNGFKRCLYPLQKFHSDPERLMAVILDRDTLKWCKPVLGQIGLTYRANGKHAEYLPDFIAETEHSLLVIEVKAANRLTDDDVLAKRDSALVWCQLASDHAAARCGKPWRYAIIPHDAIAENMRLERLIDKFGL